jgi:hypothetical protein
LRKHALKRKHVSSGAQERHACVLGFRVMMNDVESAMNLMVVQCVVLFYARYWLKSGQVMCGRVTVNVLETTMRVAK